MFLCLAFEGRLDLKLMRLCDFFTDPARLAPGDDLEQRALQRIQSG